jgi:transcriptional regulator GlxA family with amidase domain
VATVVASHDTSRPVRFTECRPRTTTAGRHWARTIDYLTDLLVNPEALAQPLILGSAARHLAATALTTFPNTAALGGECPRDHGNTGPPVLRQAVEYLESHAELDIGLADLASAVHMSPRALQYAFRRHLHSTPTEYLRQVRLRRARRDLLAADITRGDTVTSVALRWGFSSTSRFAHRYHTTYGELPSHTLRT